MSVPRTRQKNKNRIFLGTYPRPSIQFCRAGPPACWPTQMGGRRKDRRFVLLYQMTSSNRGGDSPGQQDQDNHRADGEYEL